MTKNAVKTLQVAAEMITGAKSPQTDIKSVVVQLHEQYNIAPNKKFYVVGNATHAKDAIIQSLISELTAAGFEQAADLADAEVLLHPAVPAPIETFRAETQDLHACVQTLARQERAHNKQQHLNARRAYERAYHTRTKHLHEKYVKHK